MKNYKRIILKLSGEALGDNESILSKKVLDDLYNQVSYLTKKYKLQIAIVVGGGNIWRGANIKSLNMDLDKADYMGMMATSINALGLASYFNKKGLKTQVQNTFEFEKYVPKINVKKANDFLDKNQVVIFGGGTGKPYLSTDTAAALRAKEIKAQAILMAKNNVDGVYTKDPMKYKDAKHLPFLTYEQIIEKDLKVADIKAMQILSKTNIDLIVFNMNQPNNIIKLFENSSTSKTIIKRK